jgi:uncharacterized damage-inducible protein DinB
MLLEEINTLFDYNYWANHRMMGVVETLTTEQFIKDFGENVGSIRSKVVHIMGGEKIWLTRWQGSSPKSLLDPQDFPNQIIVKETWEEIEKQMIEFITGLNEEKLNKIISYTSTEGKSFSYPLWQMLKHLINHSTYHRGQVATLLRQVGVAPKSTDLIVYFAKKSGQI